MPELPEVETIVRSLRDSTGEYRASVIGDTVTHADVLWARTLAAPGSDAFRQCITGQALSAINRRGKFLVFTLTGSTLLIHLRMSGDMRVEESTQAGGSPRPYLKHDRLGLVFSSGSRMVFNDTRKFGRAWLLDDPSVVLEALGPEPLDETLTPADFFGMLTSRSRQLKPLLMDQSFLAGLGNIYTDEALHLARLHPLALSGNLTPEDANRLLVAIREVLREGIRRNGASIDWVYRGGEFQNHFHVYGRKGQPCPTCGTPVERLVVGQRGTHICPACQPRS